MAETSTVFLNIVIRFLRTAAGTVALSAFCASLAVTLIGLSPLGTPARHVLHSWYWGVTSIYAFSLFVMLLFGKKIFYHSKYLLIFMGVFGGYVLGVLSYLTYGILFRWSLFTKSWTHVPVSDSIEIALIVPVYSFTWLIGGVAALALMFILNWLTPKRATSIFL